MRKFKIDENLNNNGWMVSFSDVVTLLLTFFVLIISMSSMDDKTIKESFTYFEDKAGIYGNLNKGSTDIVYLKKKFNLSINDAKRMIKLLQNYKLTENQGYKLFKLEKILGKDYKYKVTGNNVLLKFKPELIFNKFDFTFTVNGEAELNKLYKLIKMYDYNCYISSYTDKFPVRTTNIKNNIDLSIKRVSLIINFLKGKINQTRIFFAGWGDKKIGKELIEINLKNFILIKDREGKNG